MTSKCTNKVMSDDIMRELVTMQWDDSIMPWCYKLVAYDVIVWR